MLSGLLLPHALAALLLALAAAAALAALALPEDGRDPAVKRRVRQLAAGAPQAGAAARRAQGVEARRALFRHPRRRVLQRVHRLMDQAGVSWRPSRALAGAGLVAALCAGGLFVLFKALPLALAGGLACGVLGPWIYLRVKRERRFNACADELPHALDLMARGLRAGRPLRDCIQTVGREARDPVAREFRKVEDEQLLGATMAQAMERMAERLPIDETRFLAIAVSVQSAEGGALSETLFNLASTLRERRRVMRKLSAMSTEHTMSAKLLAALPVVVLLVVHQLNPDYLAVLLTSSSGRVMIALSMGLILAGFVVLSRMTRIEV
ncbi:MAG: type II secretion system F family protein [Pseudomonadota bacterium]